MIQQLSIFAENKKGTMADITSIVSGAGIDIYNVVTNDSAEFGIVRMLVTDTEKATELLKAAGYMVHIGECLGVKIPDDVGSLNTLLKDMTSGGINVDYIYVSYSRDSKTPLAVLHATEYDEVEEYLEAKGYELV